MLAARCQGLDCCGPMSGFNNAAVDAKFFRGTQIRSNFLCNPGRADPTKAFERSPRRDFDEVAQVL